MRRLLALALIAAASLSAQSPTAFSEWQFYRDISPLSSAGIATLTLDAEVLANSSPDGADLRIVDAAGNEIRYELRILGGEQNVASFEASELRRGAEGDSAEIVLDLGENPPEHNQVVVEAAGASYRRPAAVFGSDDAENWSALVQNGMILRIAGAQGSALIDRLRYAPSEYRYLRILVGRDQQVDDEIPVIESASVQRMTLIPAVEIPVPLPPAKQESVGQGESAATLYTFELPGRIPMHALRFSVSADSFLRTYRLTAIPGGNLAAFPLAVGRLGRREGDPPEAPTLRFQEVSASQLQLVVADQGEEPLVIEEPVVLTAARQLVIDLGDGQPSRIYYGNPSASTPDYIVESESPRVLEDAALSLELGPQSLNPAYVAPPLPLNERVPWLIYVLTAAASLALLAILRSLVFEVDS